MIQRLRSISVVVLLLLARELNAMKQFRHERLDAHPSIQSPDKLPPQARQVAEQAMRKLQSNSAHVDFHAGQFSKVLASTPFISGRGNSLPSPKDTSDIGAQVWNKFLEVVEENWDDVDVSELVGNPKVTTHKEGELVQIYAPRTYQGIPVLDSFMSCAVENGNAVLFGTSKWADISIDTTPQIGASDALDMVQEYLEDDEIVTGVWEETTLVIGLLSSRRRRRLTYRRGYSAHLLYKVHPIVNGVDDTSFEALVDALTGQVYSFEDTNHGGSSHHRVTVGGVYPATNDQVDPDGIEQPDWPMPFAYVDTPDGVVTTDSGGNLPYPVEGVISSTLSGPHVYINDTCGSVELNSTGDLNFGTSGGIDCATPGYGGAGNTKSSRTTFFELNRMMEIGRGHLTDNEFLYDKPLEALMNTQEGCGGFFIIREGHVKFSTSGDICSNPGEFAGYIVHEWGHAMDYHDATPGISKPSGEALADAIAALRVGESCIAEGYRKISCRGYGDDCTDCDRGLRDIDYLKRESQQPHAYSWTLENCGGSIYCASYVISEAIWSLWKRTLPEFYGMDDNTAHELAMYLTIIGSGGVSYWHTVGEVYESGNGCEANSGYMQYLVADDDDGNLENGTPHMSAIYKAFNDQEIACNTPPVQDSGCYEVLDMSAPIVTASPSDMSVELTWAQVDGAITYQVFRTDGVTGCKTGKVPVVETTELSFTDTGLLNDREYYYIVIPKGDGRSCFGPSSECTAVTPLGLSNSSPNMSDCIVVDFEGDTTGWVNDDAASSCSTGKFQVGTPAEFSSEGVTTQVDGDITPGLNGTGNAFFTTLGEDVDKGVCVGVSPVFEVEKLSLLSIWFYHGQRDTGDGVTDTGLVDDYFRLECSYDGGTTWHTFAAWGDETNEAAWIEYTSIVPADSRVKIRVIVSDGVTDGDQIEAAIDDLVICPLEEPQTISTNAPTNEETQPTGTSAPNEETQSTGTNAPNEETQPSGTSAPTDVLLRPPPPGEEASGETTSGRANATQDSTSAGPDSSVDSSTTSSMAHQRWTSIFHTIGLVVFGALALL